NYTQRGGRIWITIFPDKPISKKPPEVRMGGGKGDIEAYVAPVKPGRIMFEMAGVSAEIAKEALRLASHKMPVKTKVLVRGEM
ncbi:MAG: 50S ribosomal protein L16, partial [Candidatus Levyibacteriota bacterium]